MLLNAKCHSTKTNISFHYFQAGNETQAETNATTGGTQTELNDTKTDGANEKQQEKKAPDTVDSNQTDSGNSTVKQVKKELKKKTVKEEIFSVVNILDQSPLAKEVITASKEKLKALDDK